MTIQAGDVVQLKSGSPRMTVEIEDDRGVHCIWFVGDKAERDVFKSQLLQQAPDHNSASIKRAQRV